MPPDVIDFPSFPVFLRLSLLSILSGGLYWLLAKRYEPADWEERYAKLPVVTPVDLKDPASARTLVAGLSIDKAAKAYPVEALERQRLIIDQLGGTPIFLVIGEDNKSVRAFAREIDGRELEFFLKPGASPIQLLDGETGSTWDFAGRAIDGPLAGRELKRIQVLKDYWFDWKIYHPDTAYYALGARALQ